jgi:hypothetical protein
MRYLTLDRLVAAEAFVVVTAIALLVPTQNDTWWHLAAGRDMFATGRIALTETWSHTARGAKWANYEWLTQVLFFALYRAGGLRLLTFVASSAIIAAYALAWRAMRGPLDARGLLLVVAVTDSTLVWAVRPQVLTLCLVAVTFTLMLKRRWAWLPPLFVLWANLHGGVALGGLLLVAALTAALWVERRAARTIVLTGLACVAAGCLTPLGWRYWIEVVTSLNRSAANAITEWQSPAFEGPHVIFWAALVALPVAAVIARHRLRRFDTLMPIIAALFFGVLAAKSQRNVPVFLLMTLPASTRLLWGNGSTPTAPRRATEPWRSALHCVVLGATLLAAGAYVARAWLFRPSMLGWTPMTAGAAQAIRACQPPIYNPYNEGGYIVWFVPEQPVFLDSRQDPYPTSLVQAHVRAERQQDYLPLFRQYGIRCAVFPGGADGPARLERQGWRTRFNDSQWIVLDPP